jgi:PAS domain S-box-containing protein
MSENNDRTGWNGLEADGRLKPLRVLLIEDSKYDAELVRRELSKAGYELTCEVVDNLAAMRLALEERSWDVIISDYSMPQFSGRAALALYKEMGLDFPFITISGTTGEDIAVEMMKAGVHDYVMKNNLARLAPAIEREVRAARERLQRRHAETQWAHLAAIVENSDDAIYSKTLDGIILTWNRGATRIFGYEAAEMIGRSVAVLVPPYRPEELAETLRKLRRGEPIERFETVRLRKDGRAIDVSVTISPVRDRNGQIMGASVIARDITERRQRENERLRLIEELTEALAQVKTLSGLLPICAWCKSIRDDQGYWKAVETYLAEHSQAAFTHGICPDCLKRLYPDYEARSPG